MSALQTAVLSYSTGPIGFDKGFLVMMVIGLTGGIGSGKSTVAAMLRNAKIPIIDADELARRITCPKSIVSEQIRARFGQEFFNADNSLNRSALGQLVFSDKQALRDLEKITHPAIEKLFNQELERLRKENHPVVFYMVPLLFEKNLEHRVDKTLLVIASEATMLERIIRRDGLSEADARSRILSQMSNEEKILRTDVLIENNGTFDELFSNLKIICSRLCNIELSKA